MLFFGLVPRHTGSLVGRNQASMVDGYHAARWELFGYDILYM